MLRVRKERALANQDRTAHEAAGAKVGSDASKEFVFTIENIVKDVSLSQSVCEVHEDGLVMIDSGASVNVCPKWFGECVLEKSDESVQLRVRTEEHSKITETVKSGYESEAT